MKSIAIILALVFGVGLYILLRFALKRMRHIRRLKRFAKENGYSLAKKGSSVVLNTGSKIYNIRRLGLLLKHCELHFWSEKEYAIQWYAARIDLLNTPPIGETNSGRRKQIGSWDVAAGEIPVLLLSPANAPVRLSQTQGIALKRLHAGDKIGNVLFADMDFLLRHIEKNET